MSSEVRVPDIGDFDDVPVIEILVSVGDSVAVEDPLVTLESDKATMDVPAPFAGVVSELSVAVGDRVSEGSVLLKLEGAASADGASAAESDNGASKEGDTEAAVISEPPPPPSPADGDRDFQVVVLGSGPRRLHGRVPGRRPGAAHRADRAPRAPRRGLPQRRLHPEQGAAARGTGDRRDRGDGRPRRLLRQAQGGPPEAPGLEAVRRRQAHRRARRPGQAARGRGDPR